MSIVNSIVGTTAKYNNEPGERVYETPNTYSWTCPPGVYKVSVLCVGAGGCGTNLATRSAGGGGLGWKNDISVVPGQLYTVVTGLGGQIPSSNGANSYFINASTVAGLGGTSGDYNPASGGGYVGDGGGYGGEGIAGAGGAGGYSANGGAGSVIITANASPGSGGGGGGGSAVVWLYNGNREGGAGGGGVGIYGEGLSGTGGQGGANGSYGSGGFGGLGGSNGYNGANVVAGSGGIGGLYGGGGGRGEFIGRVAGKGANGVVRIVWGINRSFPNTNMQYM